MLFWLVNSLFILFAVLNINDPDWFLWVPTYLLVAAGSVSYEKKLINKKGMNVLLFFLLFVFVFSFLIRRLPLLLCRSAPGFGFPANSIIGVFKRHFIVPALN